MGSIRCPDCGVVYSVTITHRQMTRTEPVIKSVLKCPCGNRIALESRQSESVQIKQPVFTTLHPGISDPARQLFRDAEFAFWIDAFAASFAGVRTALELSLRERGLDAPDLKGLLQQAEDRGLLDENMAVRIGLAGIVRDDRQEFAVPVPRHQALSALQIASIALARLAERRNGSVVTLQDVPERESA